MTRYDDLYPDPSEVYPDTAAELIRFEVDDKAVANIHILHADGVWMQSVSAAFRFGNHAMHIAALTKRSSFPDRLTALSVAVDICLAHFRSEEQWKMAMEPPSLAQCHVSGQMYAKLISYKSNNYSVPVAIPDPVQCDLFGPPAKIEPQRAGAWSYGDEGSEPIYTKRRRTK